MVFRFLIRGVLGALAHERVRETVTKAARDSVNDAVEDAKRQAEDPERRKCDVAVVFALGIEAGGLEDRLSDVVTVRSLGDLTVRRGRLGSHRVVVAKSGPGYEAADRATAALIAAHDPDWVFSAGFAGGLDETLARHDILMANESVHLDGRRLTLDLKLDSAALADTPGVHAGALLTADHIVRLPGEKRALGGQHRAIAVDMETFAVAEVCRHEKVPLLSVRIVSDTVDDELPKDLNRLMKQETPLRKAGAVFGAVVNRPGSVKDMWQLKENALIASDKLARFLESMIQQLAPASPEKAE